MKYAVTIGAFIILAVGIYLANRYPTAPKDDFSQISPTPFPILTPDQTPTSKPPNESLILTTPTEGDRITSPLTITGQARGTWFFEATFPVVLTDWDGRIIAEAYATALDEWMSEDFVPFEAVLEFARPELYDRGALILQRANPSGLPENAAAHEITVFFE